VIIKDALACLNIPPQPDCKPVLKMLQLWKESKEASGVARLPIRAMTTSAFLALGEAERQCLLGDFIFLKDPDMPRQFFPRCVNAALFPLSVKLEHAF
jgi:hypothetical protein